MKAQSINAKRLLLALTVCMLFVSRADVVTPPDVRGIGLGVLLLVPVGVFAFQIGDLAIYLAISWWRKIRHQTLGNRIQRHRKNVATANSDGYRECWICGSRCSEKEAVWVDVSGNHVRYEKHFFFFRIIHDLWQSATVDVPCCSKCRCSIRKKSRIRLVLLYVGMFQLLVIAPLRKSICEKGDFPDGFFMASLGVCVGCFVGFIVITIVGGGIGKYWRGRKINQYPDLKEFYRLGWKFHKLLFEKED